MSHNEHASETDEVFIVFGPFTIPKAALEDAEFQAWVDALLQEEAPKGALDEAILAQYILAAWRYRTALEAEPEDEAAYKEWSKRFALAERSWRRAQLDWSRRLRDRAKFPPAKPLSKKPEEPLPPIELDPAPVNWRERIGLNPKYSRSLPLVRDTRISAEHVAGMLKAKWPIRYILSQYPQLTVDDIRACRDCHAEGMAGPWDPVD